MTIIVVVVTMVFPTIVSAVSLFLKRISWAFCSQELLAKGCELLKRIRKGDLHWKIVSVYISRMNQVMLKMKSRHVAGTITKKKKKKKKRERGE